MFVFSRTQALLLLYLAHIGHFSQERSLYVDLDLDQEAVRQALAGLLDRRLIRRDPDGRLAMAQDEPALLEKMAATLRQVEAPTMLEYCLGRLSPQSGLEECEQVLRYLDERMIGGSPALLICLELTLEKLLGWTLPSGEHTRYVELVIVIQTMCLFLDNFLRKAALLSDRAYRLTARHGNARFQPIIVILRCYLRTFIDEDVAGDILLFMEGLRELKSFEDRDMQDLVAYFEGLLHYVRGEYGEVLTCYERRPELQDWKYHRLADILALCACRAAIMQRRFSVALGTCLSERDAASLAGDRVLAMFWRLHITFCLVRMGDLDAALQNANSLFMCTSARFNNKIYIGAVRTLAIIHYLHGRIPSAYYLLRRETMQAMAMNVPLPPFEDPLMLNVLLAIEQAGFPPLPGSNLEELLPPLCASPNRSLRSAALRTKALRLAERHPLQASRLLRDSLDEASKINDFREKTLSALALAAQYQRAGRLDQASALRQKALAELSVLPVPDMSLWDLDRCLCGPVENGVEAGAEAEAGGASTSDSAHPAVERCAAALRALPVGTGLSVMLERLTQLVQASLGADRAVLFRIRGDGSAGIEAQASTDGQKFSAPDIDSLPGFSAWPEHAGLARGKGQSLLLTLEVEDSSTWGLLLDSMHGDGDYLQLGPADWREVAAMLSSEVRSCLRLARVQDETVPWQQPGVQPEAEPGEQETRPVIGPGLKGVMEQVRHVAQTTASVLLLGETGVGKEVMARRIHQLSGRKGAFVAVHPASTPETLFESEFFGHEKGAFTGASQQKIGLIEMADEGTLFIDEVGDVPPSIQSRLIRVLQEQSFRRVGGTTVIHSRFRLISATNKDLAQEVREGRFREDLLYRISVVPLRIPPLRQRRGDIVPLAKMLIGAFCKRYGRPAMTLSEEDWAALRAYDWPGNVRELKNFLERSVILNDFSAISGLRNPRPAEAAHEGAPGLEALFEGFPSLDELEARYLRYVLRQTGGRVRGEDGAETLLNIRRSTLYAKLKRHGIAPGGA